MRRHTVGVMSSGQMMGNAARSLGTAMTEAVTTYYSGQDMQTAQTIRNAESDSEATDIVRAMRQGRAIDTLMVAASAASLPPAGASWLAADTIPASSRSIGMGMPIGPVEATYTWFAGTPSRSCPPLTQSFPKALRGRGDSFPIGVRRARFATNGPVRCGVRFTKIKCVWRAS